MYDTPSRANSRTGFRSNQFSNGPPPLTMPPVPAPTPGKVLVANGMGVSVGLSQPSHIRSRRSSRDLMSSPVATPMSPSTPTLPLPQTPQQRTHLRKPASMQSLRSVGSRINLTPRVSTGEVYRGKIHVGVRAKPAPPSVALAMDTQGNSIDHESAGLFKFDKVYTGDHSNADVFSDSVEPLIQQVCRGFNATVFAYGTTGSGKTYTMQGLNRDPGVITRSVTTLFDLLFSSSNSSNSSNSSSAPAQVTLSYFEIYNERVYDLLSENTQKPNEVYLRDTSNGDTAVVGQREVAANSAEELLEYVAMGDQLRRTSSTQYNEHSSRSHAVLRIQVLNGDGISVLYLCDLAGSEKATVHSERRKEGSYINKSLLTLSSVISLLSKGGGQHVPYRDSKLTRLLQPSLSGSALVSMICTIHTNPGNTETVNSLRFAAKAKDIVVTAKKSSVFDDVLGSSGAFSGLARLVEQLQTENSQLRSNLDKVRIERDDLRDRLEVYEIAENTNADASIEAMVGISSETEINLSDDGGTSGISSGSGASSVASRTGAGASTGSAANASTQGDGNGDGNGNGNVSNARLQRELDWYKSENEQLNQKVSHLVAELASIDANIENLSTTALLASPSSSKSRTPSGDSIAFSREDEIAELKEQLKDKELVISCMTSINEAQRVARSWKEDEKLQDTVQAVEDLRI